MIKRMFNRISKRKRRPSRGGGVVKSEVHLAVRFDLLAGFDHFHHDVIRVDAVGEFDNHLLSHKVHRDGGHTLDFGTGFFHFACTVGAIHFNLVGLFHAVLQITIKKSLNRVSEL